MSRIVKILLFFVFFAVFFEAGLFSSYTIVTGQPPDVGELIDMQLRTLGSLFNFGGSPVPTQSTLKILNPEETAEALKSKTGFDGINLQTISATTLQDKDDEMVLVNITAMAFKDAQTGGGTSNRSGGAIVISPNETYSITATAMAKTSSRGVTIDVASIQITSTRKLYNAANNIT